MERTVPVGGVSASAPPVLAPGEYTIRSLGRSPGATVRLVDDDVGSYHAQISLAGAKGLYQGIVRVPTPARVDMSLSCLCPDGPDGFGGTRYTQQTVSGTYQVRALGNDRFELRQVAGVPGGPAGGPAVDTLARAR